MQRLKKLKPTIVEEQMENVMVETDANSEDANYVMDGSFHISSRKDTSIKSNFNETSIPDVNVNVSNTDANINSGEQPSTSILEKTKVTPPEFSHSESMKPQISM